MLKKRLDAALNVARSPIQPKKTDDKMTIAATITNTTSAAILVTLILNYRPAIHILQNACKN